MTFVLDASALLTVILREVEAPAYESVLNTRRPRFMTPVNILEVGIRLGRRGSISSAAEVAALLTVWDVEELDEATGIDAMAAYLRYGKGFHNAQLNMADCFAYALAKKLGSPLLYKGNDFALTDVRSALEPQG